LFAASVLQGDTSAGAQTIVPLPTSATLANQDRCQQQSPSRIFCCSGVCRKSSKPVTTTPVIFKPGSANGERTSRRPPHCNEFVMIERSEPVKSSTQWTRRAALHPVKESNRVEHFQNAASSPCVLIIRRSLVRVQPPPPHLTFRASQIIFVAVYWRLI